MVPERHIAIMERSASRYRRREGRDRPQSGLMIAPPDPARVSTGETSMPIPFSSALYYPYIDITNEDWLRSACLFWETVRTIVPQSTHSPYSTRLARELHDQGILVPFRVSPDMEEINELSDMVLDYLTDPASNAVLFGGKSVDVHPEKLPYQIRDELNLISSRDGWLRVNSQFANYYMTLLATRIGNRLGIGVVTDERTADQLVCSVWRGRPLSEHDVGLGPQWLGELDTYRPRRALPKEIAAGMLVDLVFQSIMLPKHVPVRMLIAFRRDHFEELAVFRREIAKLTSELPGDLSVEALRQAVHDQYEANVRPALASLRRSLSAQGWDAGLGGLVKVSALSAGPASALVVAGVSAPVALLAAAGISLTASAVMLANERRKIRNQNPYAYLMSIQQQW